MGGRSSEHEVSLNSARSVIEGLDPDRYEVVLGSPLGDGSPRRIEAWFAPGESTGQQLMYKR